MIESKYGLYKCWPCLCEVCTRIGCPKHQRHSDRLNHRLTMQRRESCPTVKCDWFTHREKIRVYRVRRRQTHRDLTADLLLRILSRLADGEGGEGATGNKGN